jgi:hypothetical protein
LASLSKKDKLLTSANREAAEYKKRCEALASQLAISNQKRKATPPIEASPEESPSPPKKSKAKAKAKAVAKPKPSAPSLADIVGPSISKSDDDVSVTSDLDEAHLSIAPDESLHDEFRGLKSIVCAYKLGDIEPSSSEDGITFGVCAEICEDEAKAAHNWSSSEREIYHPMVISALRIIYPDKKESWFNKPFLLSPKGTAIYWTRVLERRAAIWRAAEQNLIATKPTAQTTPVQSLTERIRAKIKKREISKTSPSPKPKSHVHKTLLYPSSDDSDRAEPASAHADEAEDEGPKLAPGPDTFSRSEIKQFGKVAEAIRNYDEGKGHTVATCDFVDSEFSDGTGILARARRSSTNWKQLRVDKACQQAATILEDRQVPCPLLNSSSPLTRVPTHAQSAPISQGKVPLDGAKGQEAQT